MDQPDQHEDWYEYITSTTEIAFLRHGEPIIDQYGNKGSLTPQGEVQIETQAKRFRTERNSIHKTALVLYHRAARVDESAREFVGHARLYATYKPLDILSHDNAISQVLWRTLYLLPFYFFLSPWLRKIKSRLPDRARSIHDVRVAAGNAQWLIGKIFDCYERVACEDVLHAILAYNREHKSLPDIVLIVGSEVSLQLLCRGIIKHLAQFDLTLAHMIEYQALDHGSLIVCSDEDVRAFV